MVLIRGLCNRVPTEIRNLQRVGQGCIRARMDSVSDRLQSFYAPTVGFDLTLASRRAEHIKAVAIPNRTAIAAATAYFRSRCVIRYPRPARTERSEIVTGHTTRESADYENLEDKTKGKFTANEDSSGK